MSHQNLAIRLVKTAHHTWDLGLTSFGGPPVHFVILKRRFVQQQKWVTQQTFDELFAVCQSLPGPASTKVLYTIVLTTYGLLPALLALMFWTLPGALGMFGLARGVSHVASVLPGPVYALLSGLNAATVGLIALAGVQLSTQTITDGMTRTILIGTACAGLMYTTLWYFPVLMVIGAVLTIAWDLWVREKFELLCKYFKGRGGTATQPPSQAREEGFQTEISGSEVQITAQSENDSKEGQEMGPDEQDIAPPHQFSVTRQQGIVIIVAFFAVFITLMVLRSAIDAPVDFRLFTNLFLAGTIIFGGGPVVIPLLREYVVAEGWVTSRDFLIGLAIIQAFPGPNFNFAVYLSALTSKYTACPPAVMALVGFLGIFSPGIVLATGFQSLWQQVRGWRAVKSAVRGINAGAVGLIWTAVYRLWEIGYLRADSSTGTRLDEEPWYLVIATLAFCSCRWYSIPAPVAIVFGGVLGLLRFAILGRN